MPDEGKEDSIATAALRNRRDRPWPLIGLGLLAVAGAVLLSRATLWPNGDSWVLFLIAGAVILWITRHGRSARSRARPMPTELAKQDSRRVRRVFAVIGIVLATLRGCGAHRRGSRRRRVRRRPRQHRRPHVRRHERRRSCAATTTSGIGSLKLDLSELQLPQARRTSTRASTSATSRCIVPADVALRVHGTAEVGEVDLPDGVGGRRPQRRERPDRDRHSRARARCPRRRWGRSASSAPYDEPACRCPRSRRALTSG